MTALCQCRLAAGPRIVQRPMRWGGPLPPLIPFLLEVENLGQRVTADRGLTGAWWFATGFVSGLSESLSDSSGETAAQKASCGETCCTESLSMGYFGHKAGNQGVRARARVWGAGRDRGNEAAVDFGARERSPVDNFDMNETGIGGWGDGGGGGGGAWTRTLVRGEGPTGQSAPGRTGAGGTGCA